MKIVFNIDERSVISIYKGLNPNRTNVINRMVEQIDYVEEKEIELLMNEIINKLKILSDEEFLKIDLKDTLNDLPADRYDEIHS